MKVIFITPEKITFGFEPIMWLRSQEMIETLRRMGVEVFPIDVKAFAELVRKDSYAIRKIKDHCIIAPNFNYFLQGAANNIKILDLIEKPVVALWDDPLGALANFLNGQTPLATFLSRIAKATSVEILKNLTGSITDRMGNRLRRFRRVMCHPLLRHFSWDSGHIEAVHSLKLVERRRVRWYPIFTYSAFLRTGTRLNGTKQTKDLGFCGNLYLAMIRENQFFKDDRLRELTARISHCKLESLNKPVWNIVMEEIRNLPSTVRNEYGLYETRRSFWNYYIYVVWYAANTLVRLGVLTRVNGEVSVHGLFADPQTLEILKDYPNLKYEGNAHNFDGLPEVYASTKINICVSNSLIHNGTPSKLIECLASGGFALCDPKDDLVRFFGPVVKKIFFRNVEELNSKIEYYLAHPVERDEIVRELGTKVRQHCTLEGIFREVIDSLQE